MKAARNVVGSFYIRGKRGGVWLHTRRRWWGLWLILDEEYVNFAIGPVEVEVDR